MGNERSPGPPEAGSSHWPDPFFWGNPRHTAHLNGLSALFRNHGHKLYLVGGAVRDLVRGREPHDWDLATDAGPERVITIFRNIKPRAIIIPTGIKHGTLTVHYRNAVFEITTFRTESDYRDGRRPESVAFTASVEEDLSRRDFTMNAIALELPGGKAVDPFGGVKGI